jgi:two-component system, cell cycle response regulator DivK
MRRLTPEDKCSECESVMLVPAQRVSGLNVPVTADYVCLDCGRAHAWTGNRLSLQSFRSCWTILKTPNDNGSREPNPWCSVSPKKRPPQSELPLVLIADDDAGNREMYAGYLSTNGFRIAEARDGAEAVRLAKRLRPAVIVLDLLMPRVDGIAAARHIRRDAKIRDTPILVLTAYDVQEQDAFDAGADVVCVKPCTPADLVAKIRRLL